MGDQDGKPKGKVLDKEDSNQRARLQAIQRAVQEAIARRTTSEDSVLAGGAEQQDRLRYYRIGIEQLLMQIVSLAERTDADYYWQEVELGEVRVPLPEEIREALSDGQTRVPWGADRPEPKSITIKGLNGFLERSWPIGVDYALPVGRTEEIREVGEQEATMELLDNTLVTALRFLGDAGMDLELGGDYEAVDEEDLL